MAQRVAHALRRGRQCQQSVTSPWRVNLSSSCNKTGASKTEKADLTLGFPGLFQRQRGQTTGERERSGCERNPN